MGWRETFAQTDMQVDKKGGRDTEKEGQRKTEKRDRGAEKRGEEKQRGK